MARSLGTVSGVIIRQVRYDAVVAQALIAEAMAELARRYGGQGDETPVDVTEFEPPDGAFLVAYLDDRPIGCVGWRGHGDTGEVAELKRLYLAPAARGRGVGQRLLVAAEESARGHGRKRMILECGLRQPEAINLYLANGYERIEDFGHYKGASEVRSFGRDLSEMIAG
jgi:GNAT superfamily N-acetyltransferase